VLPRFTIAIPTRDRADTLYASLKTCVTQDYDNFRIIVSDNNSRDDTKEITYSFNDPRVEYISTGERVSMSENFEFALSHTDGGFVGFIGDDDGLLPNALHRLQQNVDMEHVRAIVWPLQNYYWPEFFEPQLANTLSMSLHQPADVRKVSSRAMLKAVGRFRTPYNYLPSPYFGFVHQNVLSAVTARSGRFFNSINPDVYSGVAVASVIDAYHISSKSYSLSGQSQHSNGASHVTGQGKDDPDSESSRFSQENTIPFHSEIVFAPSIPILVGEAYLQARDHVGLEPNMFDVSMVIKEAVQEQNFLFNEDIQESVIFAVRRIAKLHDLEPLAEREIKRASSHRYLRLSQEALRLIIKQNPIFDCAPYGVANIYDASLVHDALLQANTSKAVRTVATARARARKMRRVLASALARKRAHDTAVR
jgi:glycosyltransferase involved in cell wall biosynthesis